MGDVGAAMNGRPYIPQTGNRAGRRFEDGAAATSRAEQAWLPRPVADDILLRIYDLGKWAPIGCNSKPAHLVFVRSEDTKARLAPALGDRNREKVEQAPVTVIVAQDPALEDQVLDTAHLQDVTLQGAYFIMAARALGLQVWPMMGLDNAGVDQVFFRGTRWNTNFVFTLGYGGEAKFPLRIPRSSFLEACRIE
jgi:3-hydroxypropanoate dehydrogenase